MNLSSPTHVARGSQIAVTAAIAFLLTLVVFGNVTDYRTNYEFVHHVLAMDTLDAGANGIRYRAVTSPIVQHALYVTIIALETLAMALSWFGAWRMVRRFGDPRPAFARAKAPAVAGLTLAHLILQVLIFAIGNEWFGMWRSKEWNGTESIFRTLVMILGALVFVARPEAGPADGEVHSPR